jgi:hypothetical protein
LSQRSANIKFCPQRLKYALQNLSSCIGHPLNITANHRFLYRRLMRQVIPQASKWLLSFPKLWKYCCDPNCYCDQGLTYRYGVENRSPPVFAKTVKTGRFLVQNSIFEIWGEKTKTKNCSVLLVYRSVFDCLFIQNSNFEWKTINRQIFWFIAWFFVFRFFKKFQIFKNFKSSRPVFGEPTKCLSVFVNIVIHDCHL